MQTLMTPGAYDERTEPLYARGLSGGHGTGRNCLPLRGLPPPAAATQTRSAMGGTVRGHDTSLAPGRQKHRWPPWLGVGCGLVRALGRVDAGEAPQRTRHGSVSGRECRGAGVHWAPGQSPPPDSGPFQHRPSLCGPWQGGGGGGQHLDVACGQGLGVCRCQYPLIRYDGPGVAHRVSQRTRHLAGVGPALWRALTKLKTRAVVGVDAALTQVQTILRSVKEHHLFAKGKQDKRQVLTRLLTEVGQLVVQTRRLVQGLGARRDRVTQHAMTTLKAMHEVAKGLIPQIVQWITTGVVAKGKIVHAGITQARAIVRNKAGKKVEFGLPYLLSRIGGGYIFGTLLQGVVDETKMPLEALAGYRHIFGPQATPALVVYDRGGDAPSTVAQLAQEGVKQIGIQPRGKRPWRVAEVVREQVRSERGKTEGIIGTLKTDKYNFNKPKERLWQTLEMAGPRSILSFNLNKLMRDLVRADK